MELSQYCKSESVELKRSTIHFSTYNPRVIGDEEYKALKRGIKKFGYVGGILANKRTNYTLIQGHQRLTVIDELQHYDESKPETDYLIKIDVCDVDIKEEKRLNVLLNNPNAQGRYDDSKLKELIMDKDFDYKDAGLTNSDLSLIGCDFLLKTEEENNLADALNNLTAPIQEEKAEIKAEKDAQKAIEREAKIEHMKDVKAQVKEAATKEAEKMDAYIMLTFDSLQAKENFLQRFGFPQDAKFIKGEDFDERCEAVLDE